MSCFEMVTDKFRKHPNVTINIPKRGTKNACGYDFFSPEEFSLAPRESRLVWTDVKAKLPSTCMLAINVRSSMGKSLIALANTQGWVDADYYSNPDNDGNIGIFLHNYGEKEYEVKVGQKIAQGMIVPFCVIEDEEVETERTGGFGSTGV